VKEVVSVAPFVASTKDEIIAEAKSKLLLDEDPENYFRSDSSTAQLFYRGTTYSIDLPTGNILIESTPPRRVLFEMNQMHLNASKGIWTYIADAFAIALILMGFTGLFMLQWGNGLAGRGKWFVGIGALIPLGYWMFYQFMR